MIKLAIVLQGLGRSSHIKYGDFLRIPIPGREEPVHCYKQRFYELPADKAEFESDMLAAGMRMRDGTRPATVLVIDDGGETAANDELAALKAEIEQLKAAQTTSPAAALIESIAKDAAPPVVVQVSTPAIPRGVLEVETVTDKAKSKSKPKKKKAA